MQALEEKQKQQMELAQQQRQLEQEIQRLQEIQQAQHQPGGQPPTQPGVTAAPVPTPTAPPPQMAATVTSAPMLAAMDTSQGSAAATVILQTVPPVHAPQVRILDTFGSVGDCMRAMSSFSPGQVCFVPPSVLVTLSPLPPCSAYHFTHPHFLVRRYCLLAACA